MQVKRLTTDGVLLLTPEPKHDHRGWFVEAFSASNCTETTGLNVDFVQDNRFFSKTGALRGPHVYRWPHQQYKLVECLSGEIFDFAVCVDPKSECYGQYVAVTLFGFSGKQLLVPPGYAHGVLALEDSIVQYKTNLGNMPDVQVALDWADPELVLDLPLTPSLVSQEPRKLLSEVKYRA